MLALTQTVSRRVDDLEGLLRSFRLQQTITNGDGAEPESESLEGYASLQAVQQRPLASSVRASRSDPAPELSLSGTHRVTPILSDQDSSKGPEETIAIDVTVLEKCERFCRCHCHRVRNLRTSPWLRNICGVFLSSYNSLPIPNPAPCIPNCHSRTKKSLQVTYYFPTWLLLGGFSFTLSWDSITNLGAALQLRVPGSVLSDTHHVWRFIESEDIVGLQVLLGRKGFCPTDTDERGQSLLLVRPPSCTCVLKRRERTETLLTRISGIVR
jgi:hypothetical protein